MNSGQGADTETPKENSSTFNLREFITNGTLQNDNFLEEIDNSSNGADKLIERQKKCNKIKDIFKTNKWDIINIRDFFKEHNSFLYEPPYSKEEVDSWNINMPSSFYDYLTQISRSIYRRHDMYYSKVITKDSFSSDGKKVNIICHIHKRAFDGGINKIVYNLNLEKDIVYTYTPRLKEGADYYSIKQEDYIMEPPYDYYKECGSFKSFIIYNIEDYYSYIDRYGKYGGFENLLRMMSGLPHLSYTK